jgi:hypothetical protein
MVRLATTEWAKTVLSCCYVEACDALQPAPVKPRGQGALLGRRTILGQKLKKHDWFNLGARSYDQVCPGTYSVPTYVCPICLTPFTVEALDDGRLSVEDVPPKSVGGRELLLTCTRCNNTAGTKLDADAKTKEDVCLAMAGRAPRPHRIKMMIGGMTMNGQLHATGGSYRLTIPKKLNKPGTSDRLQTLSRAGTSLVVEHERYSELGAVISWLRAGYLALVAMQGYQVVLDPAFDIVRLQIRECDERRMLTFVATIPADIPLTLRRVLRVLAPAWHAGWTVQFGPYLVNFPSLGNMTFYDRLAQNGLTGKPQETTYEYMGWPTRPTFGLD